MTPSFNIHPAAREEYQGTFRYYADIDGTEPGELAFAFESAFLRHLSTIIETPQLYSLRRPGSYRRVNLGPRFGEYYIAYILWQDQVTIVAVAQPSAVLGTGASV